MRLYLELAALAFFVAAAFGERDRLRDMRRAREAADVRRLTADLAEPRYELTEETPMYPIGGRHGDGPQVLPPWPLAPIHTCEPPAWYVPNLDRPGYAADASPVRAPARHALDDVTGEFEAIVAHQFPIRSASYVESAT